LLLRRRLASVSRLGFRLRVRGCRWWGLVAVRASVRGCREAPMASDRRSGMEGAEGSPMAEAGTPSARGLVS
jgi:hypothetical protein